MGLSRGSVAVAVAALAVVASGESERQLRLLRLGGGVVQLVVEMSGCGRRLALLGAVCSG